MPDLFDDHIPLLRPWLGEEEAAAVREVILSGWISLGAKVAEFEHALAQYVGSSYGVATNACTTAIHLALRLSGVGVGDHVICPSFTCMATANAIHHAGAIPIFADIDPRTYNLAADAARQAVTPQTRAIMVVHQVGLPADIDAFRGLADEYGLVVVEDAATALGATYKGKQVGSLGSPTCFSFHPRKMITTGEGGMITTDDEGLAKKARILRSAGASISDLDRHKARGVLVQQYTDVGYNYRMTDMQAAMGLVQLRKLPSIVSQRADQAKRYDEALAEMEEIDTPYVPPYATHAYSSYLIRLTPRCKVGRDALLRGMASRGISCRVGIQPLHLEPVYRSIYPTLSLPVAEESARTTMFLPIFPGLTTRQQDLVVAAIKGILASGG
jgi:perosamine synthetase